ncbi:MAG: hypothetical protein NC238_14330 [Dehalobacter sp.]|nr:hypothetical protein [Dehalobacter sp.]
MKNTNKCSLVDPKQIIVNIQESNSKYRKVVQAGIARWIKDFQEGRIKFKTVDDLKKLIEMDIVLQKNEYINNLRLERFVDVAGEDTEKDSRLISF